MKQTKKILSLGIIGGISSITGAVLLSMIAGCDEPAQSSKPTTRPAVATASTQPADAQAIVASYPEKPPSQITMDGRSTAFPPAKLAVVGHGTGGYSLLLCSDDPPTAIDPGYAGNSYVFQMRLSMDKLSELTAASWDFKPSNNYDGVSGIFLLGNHDQYRPSDVHVTFQKNGDEMLTFINGTFLHNDPANPAAPPERVQVSATLHTSIPSE